MKWRRALLAALLAAGPAFAAEPVGWSATARRLLADVIAVPSIDGGAGAEPVARIVADAFRRHGFAAADIRILPYEKTAALLVRLRAPRAVRPPILLLAHMDVVPAARADWSRDPFVLGEEGGYFYGRGTADMKGPMVAQAVALMRFKTEGAPLDRDVVFLATGDEETAGGGAARITTEWRDLIGRPDFALNADAGGGAVAADGRPLGFAIQTSEKTYATFTFTARNRGGHSSKPRPDNAIYDLARALDRLARHSFAPVLNETTRAYFTAAAPLRAPALGAAMRAFAADPADRAAADRIEEDEGERGTTRTTCVATLLAAGQAENALPQVATATVNCRIFPGTEPEAVRAELAGVAGAGIAVRTVRAFGTGPRPSPLRPDVMQAYARAVQARHPGVAVMPEMEVGATDSGALREAGIPAYGADGSWRVVPDDLREHGRDERLRVDAFYADIDHWHDLIRTLATAPPPAARSPGG